MNWLKQEGLDVWPVHRRLAELYTKQQNDELNPKEKIEFRHCLQANANMVWRVTELENLSLLASMANDNEWQHEICQQLDEIYEQLQH